VSRVPPNGTPGSGDKRGNGRGLVGISADLGVVTATATVSFGSRHSERHLFTSAWSDHHGRKPLIVAGMLLQAAALALMASTTGFWPWAGGAVLIGTGTTLVSPTLIVAVGDVAHPSWRATAVGVYRLWRDTGYVVGGLHGASLPTSSTCGPCGPWPR
jgi:MFS family permease